LEEANQYLDTKWFHNWAEHHPTFTLDNRVILLGLKTIRFAQLKATEMAAVSDVKYYICIFFKYLTNLVVDSQLAKKYNIVNHVKNILRECNDVTATMFPLLYSNTLAGTPRVKLTQLLKKSHKMIMCFVVRLHYAVHVMNELYGEGMKFDFKTFPELELVFRELKTELKTYITSDTKPNRRTTVPENLPSQEAEWNDDGLINEICQTIHAFATRLVNIADEAEDIINNLRKLRLANISTVIAEIVRKTMNEEYAKDDEE